MKRIEHLERPTFERPKRLKHLRVEISPPDKDDSEDEKWSGGIWETGTYPEDYDREETHLWVAGATEVDVMREINKHLAMLLDDAWESVEKMCGKLETIAKLARD